MRVWRLCRRAHGAFDGEGAQRLGGRWSLRGTPAVYTSASAALATLEYFVHLDVEDAPPDLVLIAADVPGSLAIEEIRVGRLPREWRRTPAPEALARLGTEWVRRGRTAVLAVPPAVAPGERNYLLNPIHPASRATVVRRAERRILD